MKLYNKSMMLLAGVAALPAAAFGANGKKADNDRPNIILIMADDMGWGDVGFNGNEYIKTPCLDSLANAGAVLNHFYSASPVSSPTRASVMTGRHPSRTGVFDANVGILRPEETTVAEILKENGYSTGFFGKWHLGTMTCTENDANRGKPGNTKEFNPPALHGFDVVFSTESKVPTWDPMKKPVRKKVSNKEWKYLEEGEEWVSYGTSYFDRDGNKITENIDGDDSRIIMDRAVEYIENSLDGDRPFLAVIWFHTPHLPVVAGPEFWDMYEGQRFMRNYAGSITAMDRQIRRLTKVLEQNGLSENTVMFFCSDNGPENGTPGSAGQYQGRKRSLHDGGVRVPSIAVWDGHIKAAEHDLPCSTADYLPTICDLAGISIENCPNILDGKSMAPILLGKGRQEKKAIGFVYHNNHSLVDGKYKLYVEKGKTFLYDLDKDPEEKNDIAAKNPRIVKKLEKKYADFISSCKASFEGEEYGRKSYDRMGQQWCY